jgi:hypothetical protein
MLSDTEEANDPKESTETFLIDCILSKEEEMTPFSSD